MSVVRVEGRKPYEIKIEKGLLSRAGEEIRSVLGKPCKIGLLTDDRVDGLYGLPVQRRLEAAGFAVCRFAIPQGETHKTLTEWGEMLNFLADQRLTRSDCVVALGGGVPGDMAGFAAACYLRGISCVQLPTTLLAMVDSSVGGKTGVNLGAGKNLAGAFYQPRLVLCDPLTLDTLPRETLLDGVAESMKYGVLGDEELFGWFEAGDWQARLEEIIRRCVCAKARLVETDERDTGNRQLLNLGHTLGHAIERCSGYAVSHGHAVAIGMVCAARLSRKLGLCSRETENRLISALERNGLPVRTPYNAQELAGAMLSDKKRMGDTLTFVLPETIGKCRLEPTPVEKTPEWTALALEERET